MALFTYKNLSKYENDSFIIWRPNPMEEKIYSYNHIITSSEILLQKLKDSGIPKNSRISIQFDTCPQIIVSILSIINLPATFCPISTSINFTETLECMLHYRVKYIISSQVFDDNIEELRLLATVSILTVNCYLYVKEGIDFNEISPSICYSIRTSGTTGNPKIIQVPLDCIMPNVVHLSQIFQIIKTDVIFTVSPPTFDPFVLDLFLVLYNGISILLTSKTMRIKNNEMYKILSPQQSNGKRGATILQITPSIFRLFNREIIRKEIFGEMSSLRILVLGGEPFPNISEIRSWFTSKLPKNKRIFNIYGITEISCWSTILELKNLENDETPLGLPIDNETILEVRNTESSEIIENGIGELFIGSSTRKCIINDEPQEILQSNHTIFRSTGDLISISKVPDVQYYYKGRKNDIVKRYGNRVNLQKIEDIFKSCENIVNAACVLDNKNNLLLLFLIKSVNVVNKKLNLEKIIGNLLREEKPDRIIYVDTFPISCHGKISKTKLLSLHRETSNSRNLKEIFINIFGETFPENSYHNSKISKNYDHIWNSSFLSLGGTSFQAISITAESESYSQKSYPNIMDMLLNKNIKINEILAYCEQLPQIVENSQENNYKISTVNDSIEFKVLWKSNFLKCIDASPTIQNIKLNQNLICVGSHSHLVICCDDNGNLISQFKLPDRIESQIVFEKDNIGYIGCYDGYLYKFNPNTGNVIWKFDSMGMIKCKPLIMNDKIIIFGNYSDEENLFCVNMQENKLIWSIKLGTKGILSSPIQISEYILVCTLDGTCSKINSTNGTIMWIKKFDTPIFSTSAILLKDNFLIVAEVNGKLYILNLDGIEVMSYKVNGTVFSSFEVIDNNDNQNSILILLGCFDWYLYCLKVQITSFSITLVWKCKLQSQIFSTPKAINLNNHQMCIISCSTIGFINIVDLCTGILLKSFQLSGEIFSTPAILNNKIFLGCRDNNLYAIEINHSNSNK